MNSPPDKDLRINDSLSVPRSELRFTTSRSSGPGGQHVNKVETRVTLVFDLGASTGLSHDQKQRVRERLASQINRDGLLQISSQSHRTQAANRREAEERFAARLAWALRRPKPRRPTTVPKALKKRRLDQKHQRAQIKEGRRKPSLD